MALREVQHGCIKVIAQLRHQLQAVELRAGEVDNVLHQVIRVLVSPVRVRLESSSSLGGLDPTIVLKNIRLCFSKSTEKRVSGII